MNKQEIFFSVDVETNGPIPGPHSLLSLGCVALDPQGTELDTWYANFQLLEGSAPHPDTMQFWEKFPDMWAQTRADCRDPQEAMKHFVEWVEHFDAQSVAVAFPAGFDFTWIYWYCMKFVGRSPFSFSCIDMKTLAWQVLGTDYRKATKRHWPRNWFHPTLRHNHHALTDAREQGYSFIQMLNHKQIP
jgi:3' exoribonuclease, RNase T-like